MLEGLSDVRNDRCIRRVILRVLRQLRQKLCDALLNVTAGRAWLPLAFGWVETTFQFDQPTALALELPIARAERLATLHHRE